MIDFIKKTLIYLNGIMKNSKKSRCLFYHDIHKDNVYTSMSTSVDVFKEHVKIIRSSGFSIVKEINDENGEILICFDDGWAGIYDNIELINKLEVPITIFVVTSFIGSNNYLNIKQIKDLNKNPLITFQSHTHKHLDLSLLTNDELIFELTESKKILEFICSREIESICFPKGLFSKSVVNIANNVGYTKQYSSLPGTYFDNFYLGVKKRDLVQFLSKYQLKSILRGGGDVLFFWYYIKHFK